MGNCPICSAPFKSVPAGTSKLGKPYEAFVACSTFGCKGKPGGTPQYVNPNQSAPSNQPKKEEPDWEKISYGKCKHAFLVEAYKKDIVVCEEVERTAEQWAEMSMRRLKDQKNGNYGSGDELDNIPFD